MQVRQAEQRLSAVVDRLAMLGITHSNSASTLLENLRYCTRGRGVAHELVNKYVKFAVEGFEQQVSDLELEHRRLTEFFL